MCDTIGIVWVSSRRRRNLRRASGEDNVRSQPDQLPGVGRMLSASSAASDSRSEYCFSHPSPAPQPLPEHRNEGLVSRIGNGIAIAHRSAACAPPAAGTSAASRLPRASDVMTPRSPDAKCHLIPPAGRATEGLAPSSVRVRALHPAPQPHGIRCTASV